MVCPECGYAMDAFDKSCPRCQGKGMGQAPAPVAPSSTPKQNVQQSLSQTPGAASSTGSPQNSGAMGCLTYLFGMSATLMVLILVFIIAVIVIHGAIGPAIVLLLFQAAVAGWVYKDAISLGIEKGQYPGLFDATPLMWSIGVLILPVIIMPGYLLSRSYHRQRI